MCAPLQRRIVQTSSTDAVIPLEANRRPVSPAPVLLASVTRSVFCGKSVHDDARPDWRRFAVARHTPRQGEYRGWRRKALDIKSNDAENCHAHGFAAEHNDKGFPAMGVDIGN